MNSQAVRYGFCNVNGLSEGKADAVKRFFKGLDMMFLVETWLELDNGRCPLTNVFMDERVKVTYGEGYAGGRRGREGLIVLCKQSLRPNVNVVFRHPSKRWVVFKVLDMFIAVGYFAPSVDNACILEMFEYIRDHDDIDSDRLVVVGDFNARMTIVGDDRTNTRGTWFNRVVFDEFHMEHVHPVLGKWTTFTESGHGITDLVLRSASQQCVVRDLTVHSDWDMGGSDHRPLTFCVDAHMEAVLPAFLRWNIGRLRDERY